MTSADIKVEGRSPLLLNSCIVHLANELVLKVGDIRRLLRECQVLH